MTYDAGLGAGRTGYLRGERSGRPQMLKVRQRGNESVQQMLKRFKKLCEKEGLNKEIKKNSYYEKPSERRRRQLRKAQRQAIRKQRQKPR